MTTETSKIERLLVSRCERCGRVVHGRVTRNADGGRNYSYGNVCFVCHAGADPIGAFKPGEVMMEQECDDM
jgi:hypothetical protein